MKARSPRRRSHRRRSYRKNPVAAFAGNPKRRRGRRRHFRRNPAGGSLVNRVKGAFGKDTLLLAGGAIAGTIGTNAVLAPLSQKVRFLQNEYARGASRVVLAVALSLVARRFNPKVADGIVLGGVIAGINDAFAPQLQQLQLAAVNTTTKLLPVAAFSEFQPVGEFAQVPERGGFSEFAAGNPFN
ncbi:MAG: hypothetical protein AB1705_21535 [Verrucomicrobiota bacterium]